MNVKQGKRATVPLKKGTVNCTVHMTSELREQLGVLAGKSGKRIGEYCRAILIEAARQELVVRETTQVSSLSGEASFAIGPAEAEARAAQALAHLAEQARLLKPPTGAPSSAISSPSSVSRKSLNPRPKPTMQHPK